MGQIEVPVCALRCLLFDREGGIVQRPVLEILLVGILHFHDELFALLVLAIHVEDGFPVCVDVSDMFAVEVFHISDDLFFLEQGVQEVDEQVLVGLGAENALETEVGEQADISFFYLSHVDSSLF